MENLLQDFKGVCVYIHDILITDTTKQEHLSNIKQILHAETGEGRCEIKEGKVCTSLIVGFTSWSCYKCRGAPHNRYQGEDCGCTSTPRCCRTENFLGMVNYYSKFLPDFATKLAPLYSLLHKSTPWQWGKQQRKEVKDLLRSTRVLAHFNDQLPHSCM